MRADIQDDLKYADNLESGIFWFAGSGRSRQLPTLLRSTISVREAAASGGAYTTRDSKISMLRSEFDEDALPEVGGLIEIEDQVWTVFAIDRAAHRGRYTAYCRLEMVRGDLASTCAIQRPQYTKDDDLVPVASWQDVFKPVACKIQEVGSELVVESQRKRARITHRVYAAVTEGAVQAGWRILDIGGGAYDYQKTGIFYNILRIAGRGVLGTLEVFDVELARKPQGM
jgi:head-tail adaptor